MVPRAPQARTLLRLNGVVSAIGGLAAIAAARPLASALGFPDAAPLGYVGLLFVVFGLDAMLISARRGLRRLHVVPFAVADAAWVLATVGILVLAPNTVSLLGRVVLAATGGVVLAFALAQFRAAREL